MAYNVAANCWPGWGDEGVVIEAAHIDVGLELAMLSLRLVEELGQGPSSVRHCPLRSSVPFNSPPADWMRPYRRSDRRAKRLRVNRRDDSVRTAAGRLPRAIAHRQAPDQGDHGALGVDEAIDRLVTDGSKQARAFADQLRTAARVLDDHDDKARSRC